MADPVGFSQENLYLAVDTPLGKDAVILKAVRGQEALSRLFRFELELASEDPALDFSKIVGETVTAKIMLGDKATTVRHVNGLVTGFSQHDSDPRLWTYRAVIQPSFWLATRKADCRIFQDQSVTDIIETVLGEVGVTDYKLDTQGSYPAREYCVQYNETCFDFLCRLMEEEGIFYFFAHEDGKHTLVIADDADVHEDCPGIVNATYKPPQPGSREEEDTVFQLAYTERVATDHFAATDYNFETPSTDLMTKAEGDAASGMEVYEYPGRYRKKDAGDGYANIRLQESETPIKELSGRSTLKSFVAGYVFPLIWHERPGLNDDYVLREVSLRVDTERYENSFVAQPAKHPYRPPRLSRRPRIHGGQTATVTGKSGEEIWTDKYGRIKVQFHWDREGKRDEKTSCFVRVAQGWAGKSWGSWFIPRIGMEVVVTFLEGDPDRPLVTGCVYNGENMQAYTLPDDQTKSWIKTNSSKGGGGSNELRFEDKKDSEEVYLHAQKDWNSVVENLRTTTINESDDELTIKKGDRTFKVEKGDESHSVKGKRTLKVDGAQDHKTGDGFTHKVTGDYTLKVSGDLTINATGNVTIKAGKKMTLQAGSDTLMKAGKNLTAQSGMDWTQKAGKNLNIKSGMNTTNKAGMNMTNKAGMNMTNKGGMNLTEKGGMALKAQGGMSHQSKGGMQFKAEGGMMAKLKGGMMGTYEGGMMGTFKGGVMAMLKGAIAKLG